MIRDKTDPAGLSEKFRELRRESGRSCLEVELSVGLNSGTVSQLENGMGTLARMAFRAVMLARYYGVSLDELVGEVKESSIWQSGI